MKTRMYLVSYYDDNHTEVVAVVEGPATPALSTLQKRFAEAYKFALTSPSIQSLGWYEQFVAYQNDLREARTALAKDKLLDASKAGYDGGSIADAFVKWIVEHHGFTVKPTTEVVFPY